jgi:hypothetical protein
MKPEERRRALQGVVLAELERFVAWDEAQPRCTFAEIEEQAIVMGQAVTQAMMRWAVAEEEAKVQRGQAPPEPGCEACEKRMRYGGRKKRRLESKAGRIEIERGYYHCETCGTGLFPPGSAIGDRGGRLE